MIAALRPQLTKKIEITLEERSTGSCSPSVFSVE